MNFLKVLPGGARTVAGRRAARIQPSQPLGYRPVSMDDRSTPFSGGPMRTPIPAPLAPATPHAPPQPGHRVPPQRSPLPTALPTAGPPRGPAVPAPAPATTTPATPTPPRPAPSATTPPPRRQAAPPREHQAHGTDETHEAHASHRPHGAHRMSPTPSASPARSASPAPRPSGAGSLSGRADPSSSGSPSGPGSPSSSTDPSDASRPGEPSPPRQEAPLGTGTGSGDGGDGGGRGDDGGTTTDGEARRRSRRRPGTAGPGRGGPTRPPGRRDSRRPADSALRAAAGRAREHRPPHWFAQRLLLVLSGQCPVHTLVAHVRGTAFDRLSALAPLAPFRPRGSDRSTPAVLAAHGSSPVPGVIEGCARIATGDRQRALAFRLEFCPDARRWQCTALTLDTDAPTAPGARTGRPSRSTRGGRGPRSRRP
ncbi:Rv3235 family protein [Streptomyces cacaoi]|uniref:Rv3235 family protein n=2 Tax=Streptomyces cacaoi TaxID=1898 RepID=UPI00280BD379|nr:Rv3235 family protein [Streptomyces cacaoi]